MCLCVTVFDTTFVIYLPKYPSCCPSLFKAVKTSRGASDRNMCVYSARHRVCPWRSKMWGTLLQIRLSNGVRCLITGEHRRRGGWHRVLGGVDLLWPHDGASALSPGCLPMTMLQKYAACGADFGYRSDALMGCGGGQVVFCDHEHAWIMH